MGGELFGDADIKLWAVSKEAWKRPRVAADAGAHAFEIEDVALLDELARAFGIDRDIDHQRAPAFLLARSEHRRAHAASGAIGADQHRSLEGRALGPHAHEAVELLDVPYAASVDYLEAFV